MNIRLFFIQWFPLLIFLLLMGRPEILDFSVFSYTFIPILVTLWLIIIRFSFEVNIPKLSITLFGLLLLSQFSVWFTGGVNYIDPMLLGIVWVLLAFLVFNSMPSVIMYADSYLYSYLIASVLWAIAAGIVWFGWTNGDAIGFGNLMLTHLAQAKPTGPFANGNVFAIMMVCSWLISVWFWLTRQTLNKLFAWVSAFFLVWVFASMSRGAWLAWMVAFVGVVIHLFVTKSWQRLFSLMGFVVLAWFLAGEMVNWVAKSEALSSRAEHIVSLGARLVLYPSVFEVWKEHWIFGVSLGNLGGHYLTGQAAAMAYLPDNLYGLGFTSSAHNHFLYALSTAGLVGLLLWVIVSILLLKSIWYCRFNIKHPAWVSLNIALVLWVQGLINISMNEVVPFFVFFIFFGLGIAQLKQSDQERGVVLSKKYFTVFGLLLVSILGYHSYKNMESWYLYGRMIYTETGHERVKLVSKLFTSGSRDIRPYVISTVVQDFMLTEKGNVRQWSQIKPNIEQALSQREFPELYQALFYTYMLTEDWTKACELGKFLTLQHWERDTNTEAYSNVCLSKKSDDFTFSW